MNRTAKIVVSLAFFMIAQVGCTVMNNTSYLTGPKLSMADVQENDVPAEAPAEVKTAIKALRSPSPGQRRDAAKALGRMGPKAAPAIPFLIELLSDESITIVGDMVKVTPGDAAAGALKSIGKPAIGPVVKALSSPNPTVRWQVTNILNDFCERFKDQQIKDALIIALQDENPKVKENTCFAIRDCPDPRAVEHLVRLLEDEHREVRSAAANALEKFGDIRALQPLIDSLQDEDTKVRRRVVDALASFNDPRAIEAILNTIRTDPSKKVRKLAKNQLEMMGNHPANEMLLSALKDSNAAVRKAAVSSLRKQRGKNGFFEERRVADAILSALKDEDAGVRKEASEAASLALTTLARIPPEDTTEKSHESSAGSTQSSQEKHLDTLKAALKDSVVKVRAGAVVALSKIYRRTKDSRILDALIPMTRDKAPEVRISLTTLVYNERTAKLLERLLQDSSPQVRRVAARRISGSSSVDALIQALKDEDAGVRAKAAESLGKIGDTKAVEAIMDLIRSPKGHKEEVGVNTSPMGTKMQPRAAAIKALGHLGDPRTADLLVGILQNDEEDLDVRCSAARALRGIKDNERVLDVLHHKLKSGKKFLRRNIAVVLGAHPVQEKSVKPLIKALRDEDSYVRSRAAKSLGRIGDRSAVGPLIEALDDQDASVRSKAAYSLGSFKDPRAVEALISLSGDEQGQVSKAARRALRKITRISLGGDPRKWQSWWRKNKVDFLEFIEIEKKLAKQPSAKLLQTIKASLHDSNAYVRMRSVYALRYFPSKEVLGLLHNGLEDRDPGVRKKAVLALEKIKDPRSFQPLVNTMKDEDPDVRSLAVRALARLPGTHVTKQLVLALQNSNRDVQISAQWALIKREDMAAVTPLIALVTDEREDMRNSAIKVLKRLTGRNFGTNRKRWAQWWAENKGQ